jgi:hypothetical protein
MPGIVPIVFVIPIKIDENGPAISYKFTKNPPLEINPVIA